MKKFILAILLFPVVAFAQATRTTGLQYVNHDSTLIGTGTSIDALGLAPCPGDGEIYETSGGVVVCTPASTIGPGTTGRLTIWTSPTAIGDYGGSSPTPCTASHAMQSTALAADGTLTTSCIAVVPGVTVTAPVTGGGSGNINIGLAFTSNFSASSGSLDLSTAVTTPGS